MSYASNINNRITNMNTDVLKAVVHNLGGTIVAQPIKTYESGPNAEGIGVSNLYQLNNIDIKLNGKTYTIKNTSRGDMVYNLTDVIAAAKAAGITNTDIKNALNITGIKYKSRDWETADVASFNAKSTTASIQIQDYINEHYPGTDAYVSVFLNKNGDGYTTRVTYTATNPLTGQPEKIPVDLTGVGSEKLSTKKLAELVGLESPLGKNIVSAAQTSAADAETNANLKANAEAQVSLGNKVLSLLNQNPNLGTGMTTDNTLTQEQIDASTAKTPDEQFIKENLGVWNNSKDAQIFNNIYQSLQNTDPQLIERTALKGADGKVGLEDLAKAVSDEQLAITNRNIDNQRQQLLQQIRNDPELYNSITQQLRADNAAGTIAGQRAANAQQLASQADTTYDKSASELYSNLFSGDKSVADSARSTVLGNAIAASDNYINSMLSQAEAAAAQGQITVQELESLKQSVVDALGVDQSKYDNALAVEQAKAGKNASDISSELSGNYDVQKAEQDSALSQVADLLGVGENYLQSAANGSADVAAAIETIKKGFANAGVVAGKDYTVVKTPELEEPTQFTNKQYNDLLNSDAFQTLIDNKTIKSLTEQKTLEQLLSEYNLDMLTEDGMKALYEGYAKEANEQSNKVFNKAQRAYIAAITAGDAKTADQLAKLAANAGVSKGNLYAASALANQFKQQAGLNNSGRQLATDFLNQQSTNKATLNQAALDANKALTAYLGDGSDTYGSGSLYGALNQFNQNAASASKTYGELGSAVMNTTQGLNTSNTGNTIKNYDILAQLANQQTTLNAAAAANNITNTGTKNTLGTEAAAMSTQGNTTLKKLK